MNLFLKAMSFAFAMIVIFVTGCSEKSSSSNQETRDTNDTGTDADTDTDTDTDSDTDSDTDTDGDTDTDSDTDSDTDTDTDSETDTDTDIDADCSASFYVDASLSSAISTVGIVEWSTSLDSISSASIEFGLNTDYRYTAPVDLTATNFRTLLLGMKSSSRYHFRIAARSGSKMCMSSDYTIETGPPPIGLVMRVDTIDESAVSDGFIISSSLFGLTAFILDRDGDLVWWHEFSDSYDWDGISRAKMSADGKSMWAGTANVGGGMGYGHLYRISMDGIGDVEVLNIDRHHDFTVLPDNSVVYIEYTENDGDKIVERSPSGEIRTIYTMSDDFVGSGLDWSHCNAIHYIPEEDAFTISCLLLNAIIKVSRSGELLWDFEGDGDVGDFAGASWVSQHGHQLLDNGNLLMFNNGDGGFDSQSVAREFILDESARQATEVWSYDGQKSSTNFGDVQRCANGNTLVVYSNMGVLHEVTRQKTLVRSISGSTLGYIDWRPTLYGPPSRW